jgi:hypothetical protein
MRALALLLLATALAQSDPTTVPAKTYDGGHGGTEVKLRIGNGGAGQSGLVGGESLPMS